eukprot:11374174-Ditylum_brightwellii.AAC.2
MDCITLGELTIDYCFTELMVADFYTKPLQGKLFKAIQNRILNLPDDPCVDAATQRFLKCEPESAHVPKQDTSVQECVGESGNKKDKIKSRVDNTRLTEHVSTTVAWESTIKPFPATYFMWRHFASHFNRMATTDVAHN